MNQVTSRGNGIGRGHSGITGNFPVIRQTELPPELKLAQTMGHLQADTTPYRMGKVTIMVSWSDPEGWHISIAHPDRYPTWDEIAHIRYSLIPDECEMAMMLPTKNEYVNIHRFCFQLHEMPYDWREYEKISTVSAR